MLCGLADGLDALVATGVTPRRVLMVGGGAASEAVRRIAPAVLGLPVVVPEPGEYVADGACRQAAWALSGAAAAPAWALTGTRTYEADPTPQVRSRYAEVAATDALRPVLGATFAGDWTKFGRKWRLFRRFPCHAALDARTLCLGSTNW